MKELRVSVPRLPRAVCKGYGVDLFETGHLPNEGQQARRERIDRAVALCHRCPELESCRSWVESTPRAQFNGLVAGGLVRPNITFQPQKEKAS